MAKTNPTVIARYVMGPRPCRHGRHPRTYEACVVVEDGRVAGVATQQRMEVHPSILPACSVATNPTALPLRLPRPDTAPVEV